MEETLLGIKTGHFITFIFQKDTRDAFKYGGALMEECKHLPSLPLQATERIFSKSDLDVHYFLHGQDRWRNGTMTMAHFD